jgi:hypothetical protein
MFEKVNASIPAVILIEGDRDLYPASTIDEFNRFFQHLDFQDVTQIAPSAQRADGCIETRLLQRYFDRWCTDFDTLQMRTLAHDQDLFILVDTGVDTDAPLHARREPSTFMRINIPTTQEAQYWEDFRAARGAAA